MLIVLDLPAAGSSGSGEASKCKPQLTRLLRLGVPPEGSVAGRHHGLVLQGTQLPALRDRTAGEI